MEPINTATKFEDHKSINDNKVIEFKTMGTKVKNTDIPILNQRLKIYGYQTIGELIHDFIKAFKPKDVFCNLTCNWDYLY
jgi:hypothetical protein